ncbi:MAG: hypothetical protein DMG52_35480 [Acidobacteria bacterium]|nr:MAG: hypothetical protein DMG52_35480 [Acidobacteriota bacterium]
MDPGSARYDPGQTDVERHAYANLVLMCPTHHTVIDDDEEAYTVERLCKIKAAHEAQSAPIPDAEAAAVAEAAALSPIHSLAYFGPVIDEVLHNPVPDTYIEYLRRKMQPFAGKKVTGQESCPASLQKNTDSDDR